MTILWANAKRGHGDVNVRDVHLSIPKASEPPSIIVRDLLLNIRYAKSGNNSPYNIAKMIDGAKSDGNATPPIGEGNVWGYVILEI